MKTEFPNNDIIDVQNLKEKTKGFINNIRINAGDALATGFLCKIYIENDKPMPSLITCYHAIDEDYIKKNPFIFFTYLLNEGIQEKVISLEINRIIYQDRDLDATIIEIKEEDDLDIIILKF